jgi:predicted metal-dependent hydrolase
MLVTDLLQRGFCLFNEQKYFEAHEVWEDLWRLMSDPQQKISCQGLIQAAVGLHHLSRGNRVGARSQLQKSIRNLEVGGAKVADLDIETLVRELSEILDVLPERVPSSFRIRRLK